MTERIKDVKYILDKAKDVKYVKDKYGHTYIFNEHLANRIGPDLKFIEPPVVNQMREDRKKKQLRTLQEVRETASKDGLDIPDGTPLAKAQSMYDEFMSATEEEVTEQ